MITLDLTTALYSIFDMAEDGQEYLVHSGLTFGEAFIKADEGKENGTLIVPRLQCETQYEDDGIPF